MISTVRNRTKEAARSVAAYWNKDINNKDWFVIYNQADQTEILIYDVIGWPFIEASAFIKELSNIKSKDILVRINSPGGDVFDGTAIYNALSDHPAKITTRIEGVAASMAGVIALAGDARQIAKNAFYMIHSPWTIAIGSAKDIKASLSVLEKVESSLSEIYVEKSGQKEETIREWMDAETWWRGEEAKSDGFMDAVTGESKTTAKFDLSIYSNIPKGAVEPTRRDIERVLTQDAKLSRSQARDILNHGFNEAMQDAGMINESLKNLIGTMKI
jgi:ATP-dependent Clp endopeptidase proteolytic subunit ClpP